MKNVKNDLLVSKYKIVIISSYKCKLLQENKQKYSFNNEILNGCFSILNKSKGNIMIFIYNNKEKIHELLYILDTLINIEDFYINYKYNYLFFLSLLISENNEIINYSYSKKFIIEVNDRLNFQKNLEKLLISKIIIEIINNYRGLDEYDKKIDEEILEELEREKIKNIKDNLIVLEKLNVRKNIDEILGMKIDDLYSKIITSLITSKNFNDYDYTIDIINQLHLEEIDLTEHMYNELLKVLNKNNEYLTNYKISSKEDLFNEKIINFYYIIIKYLLKNSFYIYQIPYLLEARKVILKLIKENDLLKENIQNKDRLIFVLRAFADSEFYLKKKIPNSDIIKLNEVKNYYNNYLFESKKNEINEIDKILKSNKDGYENYLKDYDDAKKWNLRIQIIKYLFNGKNTIIESEEKINQYKISWVSIEKAINDKKLRKIRTNKVKDLHKYFIDSNNKRIINEIFTQDKIDNFINYFNESNKIKKNKEEKIEELNKNEEMIEKENSKNKEQEKDENKENQQNNSFQMNTNNILYINPDVKKDSEKNNKTQDYLDSKKENSTSADSQQKTKVESSNKSKNENNNNYSLSNKNSVLNDIITNSLFVLHSNKRGNNPFIEIKEIYFGENLIKITKEEIKKQYEKCLEKKRTQKIEKNEKCFIKFIEFVEEIKKGLEKEFLYNYKLRIKLNFKEEKSKKNGFINISCLYIFYTPDKNEEKTFRDHDILQNGMYSGFEFLILDINSESYKNIEYSDDEIKKQSTNKKEEGVSKNIENHNMNKEFEDKMVINNQNNKGIYQTLSKLDKHANKENILEFIDIVEKDIYFNGFIIELEYGYYAICKKKCTLNIYNIYFNQIIEIKNFNDMISNVVERTNSLREKSRKELIVCTKSDINLVVIDLEKLEYKINTTPLNKYNLNFLEIKSPNCLLLSQNGLFNYLYFFDKANPIEKNLTKNVFYRGLKINENFVALISNKILPNGDDKLTFFDNNLKKLTDSIEDYSFVLSQNGIGLIHKEILEEKTNKKKKKNKKKKEKESVVKNYNILICACKKYQNEQRNGILISIANLEQVKTIDEPFLDTDDFEVNCICPLSKIENKNKNYGNIDEKYKNNINMEETNFFLAGGFDTEKRQGKIKLYNINFSDRINETKIEYMQDIEFNENEFDGFETVVNCIMQSKISGNIIVGSYDEKVYLFTKPNLDYFLK